MFKNVIKIGALAGMLALSCGAFAQEKTYAPEYPQYGFWSNWSAGATVGLNHWLGNGTVFGDGMNVGMGIFAEKELNHVWAIRLTGEFPGFMSCDDTAHVNAMHQDRRFDRYGKLFFTGKFSINNAIKGYDPARKGSLYLLANGGIGISANNAVRINGNVGLLAGIGLGYSYKCCEKSTLFVEAKLDAINDVNNFASFQKGNKGSNCDATLSFGWMYHFGATAEDLELISQRAKLSQENFDNMNTEIANLTNQVVASKQAEQRLQNNINDLEERLATALKNPSKGYADSLQAIINQIKDDQLTFYALPFSILYAVDQWRVPADQMSKVKAIARVINDTENAKFNIVGFCDKSGSDSYNMKLSQKRAEELKRLLVEKYGVAEDRLSCDWKGKGMAFGDISYSVNRRTSVYRVIE